VSVGAGARLSQIRADALVGHRQAAGTRGALNAAVLGL
jgi:hypothetical protein